MKYTLYLIGLLSLSLTSTSYASLSDTLGHTPKIMALGDSITAGCCNPQANYEEFLASDLTQGGYSFSFVGSVTDSFGQHIEAHPGYTPSQLVSGINDWMASAMPDIVLLHAGSNGLGPSTLSYDPTVSQWGSQVSSMQTLLTDIVNKNPNAYIIVADIIDLQTPNSSTTEYNRQLNLMVNSLGDNTHLSMINMQTLLNGSPSTNYVDGTHPSAAGFQLMGDAWYSALTPILNSNVSTVPIPPSIWLFSSSLLGILSLIRRGNNSFRN